MTHNIWQKDAEYNLLKIECLRALAEGKLVLRYESVSHFGSKCVLLLRLNAFSSKCHELRNECVYLLAFVNEHSCILISSSFHLPFLFAQNFGQNGQQVLQFHSNIHMKLSCLRAASSFQTQNDFIWVDCFFFIYLLIFPLRNYSAEKY